MPPLLAAIASLTVGLLTFLNLDPWPIYIFVASVGCLLGAYLFRNARVGSMVFWLQVSNLLGCFALGLVLEVAGLREGCAASLPALRVLASVLVLQCLYPTLPLLSALCLFGLVMGMSLHEAVLPGSYHYQHCPAGLFLLGTVLLVLSARVNRFLAMPEDPIAVMRARLERGEDVSQLVPVEPESDSRASSIVNSSIVQCAVMGGVLILSAPFWLPLKKGDMATVVFGMAGGCLIALPFVIAVNWFWSLFERRD